MCIILDTVLHVAKTRIYTTLNKKGTKQLLIYQNTVDTDKSNTMILPVPNPDSVRFINLERYPKFFENCEECFHKVRDQSLYSCSASVECLPVFDVGSYKVSVATTLDDLKRADRMFNLDPKLEAILADTYKPHFGFILCRLRKGFHTYHPLAYVHEKDPSRLLFVPTLHYHDHGSKKAADADWDHIIYSTETDLDNTLQDNVYCSTTTPVKWELLPTEFHHAAAKKMNRWTKYGDWQNKDLWLRSSS